MRYFDGRSWTPHISMPPGMPPQAAMAPGQGPPAQFDAATRMALPVGRTPASIVAGYVALTSVLLFPAPIALVLGIRALRQLKDRPGMYGRGRAIFAIVMGGLFSVIGAVAIIGSALH